MTTRDIVTVPTEAEKTAYAKLHKEVLTHAKAMNNFFLSLGKMRDEQLYRVEFDSFDAYLGAVGAELGRTLGSPQASRLISWVRMQDEIGTTIVISRESHARELKPLRTPELRIEAYRLAEAAANIEDCKLTARHVAAAAAVVQERQSTGGLVDGLNGNQVKAYLPITNELGAVVTTVREEAKRKASNNRVGIYLMAYVKSDLPSGEVLMQVIPDTPEQKGTLPAMPDMNPGEAYVVLIYRKTKAKDATK